MNFNGAATPTSCRNGLHSCRNLGANFRHKSPILEASIKQLVCYLKLCPNLSSAPILLRSERYFTGADLDRILMGFCSLLKRGRPIGTKILMRTQRMR